MPARIFYVGTGDEVEHHARPLLDHFPVEMVPADRVAEVATAADLAIFFSEHFRRFRSAVMQLREKHCRTLYAIDGILEWRNAFENREDEPACPWTMRPVLCDKVAVIGRSQARILDFWGNQNKVELVGLPRLDDLAGQYQESKPDATATPQADTPRRPRLLVMTAKWPAFTDSQQANLERSLGSLQAWGERHPEVELVWRLTRDLDRKLGVENSLEACGQGDLVRQLQHCDALITTPSTAMLEGMLLHKPTAILEFNDCPQFNSVAWQIRHPDQLDSMIAELLAPSPFKLAQQEYALHDTLECQTPARPRLIRLIEMMLEYAAGSAPANLVPIESSPRRSPLGSDFLYHQYRLAETDDTVALKSQLAFMEREYALLQARNELVEQAFEEAKSTIDNVFNNPVVSPFIKAGELAGRLFSKPSPSGSE